METLNLIKKSVVILLMSFILACGVETVVALVFIPAFAGQWDVENEDGYTFNLQSDDIGKEAGVIDGNELNRPNGESNNELNGSFDGLNIEITIERSSGNIKYTGKMVPISDKNHQIKRIDLKSSEDQLILIQQE